MTPEQHDEEDVPVFEDLVADTGGLSRRSAMIIAMAATAAFSFGDVFRATPAHAATVPSSAQADAQALLASGRVTFGHPEPRAQIEAYAAGYKRQINGRDCHINGVILAALRTVVVDRGFSISISSLNRYCEMSGNTYSYHYRDGGGRAVDINRVNGVQSTGGTAQDLALISAMTSIIPTPAGLGQSTCAGHNVSLPPGWAHFPDGCNHNHFEYRGTNDTIEEEDDLTPEQAQMLTEVHRELVQGGSLNSPGYTKADIQHLKSRIAALEADHLEFKYTIDGAQVPAGVGGAAQPYWRKLGQMIKAWTTANPTGGWS